MNVDFDFLQYATSENFLDRDKESELKSQLAYIKEQGYEYEYEERAAILEHDGGLPRQEAEKKAIEEITQRFSEDLPF